MMKQFLSLCLTFVLLLSFWGCAAGGTAESVEFYYQRTRYVYGSSDGVIAPETREISERSDTLTYMLSLYLRGPLSEGLKAPFPTSTKLLSVTLDGSTLCVTLDTTFTALKDMELTIACACIARTCFSLADVTQVQIRSIAPDSDKSVNMVISMDSLLLKDNSGLPPQTVTEETE